MQSPCVKICLYDPKRQLCSGCGRTLQEIGDWTALSDDAQRRIMAELPQRLAKLKPD
jgi:predicted Fe-S protein YdhL (DUF1289 family)